MGIVADHGISLHFGDPEREEAFGDCGVALWVKREAELAEPDVEKLLRGSRNQFAGTIAAGLNVPAGFDEGVAESFCRTEADEVVALGEPAVFRDFGGDEVGDEPAGALGQHNTPRTAGSMPEVELATLTLRRVAAARRVVPPPKRRLVAFSRRLSIGFRVAYEWKSGKTAANPYPMIREIIA